jgi:bacteriocin-like protein
MNNQTSILNDAELNHVSGGHRVIHIGQLNTKTSMVLNEANDAEARVASLLADMAGPLRDLRGKF